MLIFASKNICPVFVRHGTTAFLVPRKGKITLDPLPTGLTMYNPVAQKVLRVPSTFHLSRILLFPMQTSFDEERIQVNMSVKILIVDPEKFVFFIQLENFKRMDDLLESRAMRFFPYIASDDVCARKVSQILACVLKKKQEEWGLRVSCVSVTLDVTRSV
jgi:hypothetical protein